MCVYPFIQFSVSSIHHVNNIYQLHILFSSKCIYLLLDIHTLAQSLDFFYFSSIIYMHIYNTQPMPMLSVICHVLLLYFCLKTRIRGSLSYISYVKMVNRYRIFVYPSCLASNSFTIDLVMVGELVVS